LASKGQGCQTLGPYTAYIPQATTSMCAPRTRKQTTLSEKLNTLKRTQTVILVTHLLKNTT